MPLAEVIRIEHRQFTSNTFLIKHPASVDVWLVDIGNYKGVQEVLPPNAVIKGVFVTHAHYDHIYGINELMADHSACTIYASEYAANALKSSKLNLSFYHEDPVDYAGGNISLLHEGDRLRLYNDTELLVLETPGHNQGSLSFCMGKYLFTGDSFIPGYDVVTKLKSGNKTAAQESLQRLKEMLLPGYVLCPGHGPFFYPE